MMTQITHFLHQNVWTLGFFWIFFLNLNDVVYFFFLYGQFSDYEGKESKFNIFLYVFLARVFVFIGSLIQVPMSEKGKITRGRLGSLSLKKEGERQCFLFSKHLIICTRGSGGKLHITKVRQD